MLAGKAELTAQSSCALGVRIAPMEVAVEWQRTTGAGKGFGCEKILRKELRVFVPENKISFSKSFGVSLLTHTGGPEMPKATPTP